MAFKEQKSVCVLILELTILKKIEQFSLLEHEHR